MGCGHLADRLAMERRGPPERGADVAEQHRAGRDQRWKKGSGVPPVRSDRAATLHSGSVAPEPPISLGMSFILGRPSLMRSTASW